MSKHHRSYIRVEKVPVEIIVPLLLKGEGQYIGVKTVNLKSSRVQTYSKSQVCVNCGKKISYFAVEKHRSTTSTWHLNAYHLKDDGEEMMMTSDHILAKSMGGDNGLENRQVMCIACNILKGSYSSVEEGIFESKLAKTRSEISKYNLILDRLYLKLCRVSSEEKLQEQAKKNILRLLAENTDGVQRKLSEYEESLREAIENI